MCGRVNLSRVNGSQAGSILCTAVRISNPPFKTERFWDASIARPVAVPRPTRRVGPSQGKGPSPNVLADEETRTCRPSTREDLR